MFVRLHDQLVELPTARDEAEIDGRIAFTDGAGVVIAWFEKLDVLAYSPVRERLQMEFSVGGVKTALSKTNGHSI